MYRSTKWKYRVEDWAAREERRAMKHTRSRAAFERAMTLIPGGVNSPARAFGGVQIPGTERLYPIVFASADGAILHDIDGNSYIDYVGSWGPMILGHRDRQVEEAIQNTLRNGTSFGAPTVAENELAQRVVDAVDSVEKVRLVNSGTEATMSAIRLARGVTGRDKIIKFAGNYHGHADSLLVAAGSAAATLGVPNSPGVTVGTAKDSIVLPYNNVEKLTEIFDRYPNEFAAVIFEPVVGNMGCVPPDREFLHSLRYLTRREGTILICDEVMTGFRVAYAGAQSLYGIEPDLTTFGKIIGGGLPVGAYAGRAELMDHVLPAGRVFQAGTLSGNPLACAAGIATLDALRERNVYPILEAKSRYLAEGIQAAARDAEVTLCIQRVGSMMTLFFQHGPIVDWDTAAKSDTQAFAIFFREMLEQGIYLPCSQFEAMFVSVAHTEELLDRTITAARKAFAVVRATNGSDSPTAC